MTREQLMRSAFRTLAQAGITPELFYDALGWARRKIRGLGRHSCAHVGARRDSKAIAKREAIRHILLTPPPPAINGHEGQEFVSLKVSNSFVSVMVGVQEAVVEGLAPERARRMQADFEALRESTRIAGDWIRYLGFASSENRVQALRCIWRQIPWQERSLALATAISGGDALVCDRDWLVSKLRQMQRIGLPVFDSDEARVGFDSLPSKLDIFRGTVKAEGRRYGVSWTLDRQVAEWFATKHGRFRNLESQQVVVHAIVKKSEVTGYLTGRKEREILVRPSIVQRSTCIYS